MPMFTRVEEGEVIAILRRFLKDNRIDMRAENLIGSPRNQIDGGFAYSRTAVATTDVLDGGASATDAGEYTIDGGNA